MNELDSLLRHSRGAFNQDRTAERARQFAYGALTCLGRHTISGILTATGQQFVDWSAAYRLFAGGRIDTEKLFDVSREEVLKELGPDQMIVAHMDDTHIRKTGKKIYGTSWRRDPLGPPFQNNLIWGQRFLQISLALPDKSGISQSRAIPIDFHHCPTARKIPKKASKEQIDFYKEQKKQTNLSLQGSLRINHLRQKLDEQGAEDKELYLSVDGSYTNKKVLTELPQKVTLIGRIRKDSRLYELPDTFEKLGRKKVYGNRLPTPEEIRKSDKYEWQTVKAWTTGKTHEFKVKVVKDVKWRVDSGIHNFQLVIVKPLYYRLTKKSDFLHKDPAYLICTDKNLDVEKLLQAYLWRWEIEVNFRDQKNILGCGKAQVRIKESVEKVPSFIAAIYGFLLIAAHKAHKDKNRETILPRPKWYPAKRQQRLTTSEIINLLRTQLWAKAVGYGNFSGFVKQQHKLKTSKNYVNTLQSAIFYIRN